MIPAIPRVKSGKPDAANALDLTLTGQPMRSEEPTVEESQLDVQERVIAGGPRSFVAVGAALAKIRDQRLYKTPHTSFEDYSRQRWGLTTN